MNADDRQRYAKNAGSSPRWTEEECLWLRENYPHVGQKQSAVHLNRTAAAVRYKASVLGLRLDQSSDFWTAFQVRAAATKVGRKRPDQAKVMSRLHSEGKLRKTPEQNAATSQRWKEWHATHEHPRGMKGKRHTQDTLNAVSAASVRTWSRRTAAQIRERSFKIAKTKAANGTVNVTPHGTWKADWRTIGGQTKYFRSRWEANYARYLEWLKTIGNITSWEHEPETFWFDGIKRGCVSYLPDFRVTNPNGTIEYHEVKGWMDDRSKTKIKRMAKYYPAIKLIVIDAKGYRKLAKQIAAAIDGWE